jgi:DeoR family fructose operon transcriptional repressor
MSPEMPSLKVDRFKQIIGLINAGKRISLGELEDALQVSRITIQRDLVELENRKLIRRFHGGAMSLDYSKDFYDYDLKKSVNIEAKKIIAAKANHLIRDNSCICLDSSSTVYYLTETIFPGNVMAFTCCIDCFKNLTSREDIQVVLAGGRINKKTGTLCGPEAVSLIRKFYFDLAFISAESFIPDRGFFDPHEDEVQMKRAIIECSRKRVMLIDSSKLTETAGIQVCSNDEIDYVVTENPDKSSLRKIFKDKLM